LSLIFRKEEVFCGLGPTTLSVLLWAYGATLSKASVLFWDDLLTRK
jgi:hypothetical protein